MCIDTYSYILSNVYIATAEDLYVLCGKLAAKKMFYSLFTEAISVKGTPVRFVLG